MPADLECVVTHCDNPDTGPNTSGLNYNLEWDGERVPINGSIIYPCLDGNRHEQAVSLKQDATNITEVKNLTWRLDYKPFILTFITFHNTQLFIR